MQTPLELGYHFPAEWENHEATWLTWPYLDDSFPGKMESIYTPYLKFIKEITNGEIVRINVPNEQEKNKLLFFLHQASIELNRVEIFIHPTNDVWCRDHGPAFVVNRETSKKAIVNWKFNAWGDKYPSEMDDKIPESIAEYFKLPIFQPGIVMEGGSVEFNGNGTILTTTACLLNKNRNPHLSQQQIDEYLCSFYGMKQVLWLGDGIAGDDTDGHVDDITRFVNHDTVLTAVETNESDANYHVLQENLEKLKEFRLTDGSRINIVELPMPHPVYHEGRRLPASYANFYITNKAVIVPLFQCVQDEIALEIISSVFPGRKVTGIESNDIVWGLGSFHCLSQQEPSI